MTQGFLQRQLFEIVLTGYYAAMVMEPLSKRLRLLVFLIFSALFVFILPIVILYASGYRFKSGLGIVRTGGIYITVPYDDAVVKIDGTEIGISGFLKRNFYLGDLTPSSYEVSVRKEGYYTWVHTLVVEQQIVSDARALLIPEEITLLRISSGLPASTSTRAVSTETWRTYLKAFESPMATTTTPSGAYDLAGNEAVFVEKGNVYVRWIDESASPSSNFCSRPSLCVRQMTIEDGRQTSTSAAYFAGGVVFRTTEGGVFIRESSVLPGSVLAPIYARRGADFRILDDGLVIKEGNNLYQVTGL